MSGIPDRGRQLRAMYAFRGAAVELDRTVPLGPDEQVLFHGVMRLRGHGLVPRPALLRLTRPRLVVLAHFAFLPDRVWDVPRSAVHGVKTDRGELQIAWHDQRTDRQVLRLGRWTGKAVLDRPVRDAQDAVEALGDWLADRDEGNSAPPGHERR